MFVRQATKWLFPSVMLGGYSKTINSQAVTVLQEDVDEKPLLVRFDSAAITDAGSGYGYGCKHIKNNGDGTTSIYMNQGSTTSCDFNLIETVAQVITGVTAGTGMTGGGTEGSVTLNVGAGRGTTVRADAVDVGVNVWNTLGALGIGKLVNLSGFNTTNGITMTLADADAGIQATHVTIDAIANNAAGVVYPIGLATGDVTNNLDTSGRTIGDLVYLSGTAGGFVFAALTGADQLSQAVGVVKVVSATIGQIEFFPGALRILKLPTSMLQDDAVTAAKIVAGAVTPVKSAQLEAVTTTADGLTTGVISATARHVTVTSASASDIATLPASVVGKEISGFVGSNGFRLQTTAASNITINGVDSDGSSFFPVAANTYFVARCVSATAWLVYTMNTAGGLPTGNIANASITAAKVAESTSATATADGLTTGAITALTGFKKFVAVTSAAATDAITLPGINAETIGQEIFLTVGANGYELLTVAASNVTINQVDSDGSNQLDVAANTTVRCTQISSTAWLAETIAATTIAITAPDND